MDGRASVTKDEERVLYWVRLGWVSQPMGWVGSGHTKWTHGQLCRGATSSRLTADH